MAHVAEIIVIQADNLYRSFLFHDRTQFLNVHLQSAVTHKYTYSAVGTAESSSDSCRKAKTHRAESTRSNDTTFPGIFKVAGRDHLILTYICHQYGFVTGRFAYRTHHFAHTQ